MRLCLRVEVVQTDLAAGDEFVVVDPAELHRPELIRAALVDGLAADPQASGAMGA